MRARWWLSLGLVVVLAGFGVGQAGAQEPEPEPEEVLDLDEEVDVSGIEQILRGDQEMLQGDRSKRPHLASGFSEALLEATASWGVQQWDLREALGNALPRAVAARRISALSRARKALDGGRLLRAASQVKRFAELWPLPDDVVLLPGHAYLANNLRFTLDREPDNEIAATLLADLQGGEPAPRLTLGQERTINTFFRLDSPSVQAGLARAFPGRPLDSHEQRFIALRELRNRW